MLNVRSMLQLLFMLKTSSLAVCWAWNCVEKRSPFSIDVVGEIVTHVAVPSNSRKCYCQANEVGCWWHCWSWWYRINTSFLFRHWDIMCPLKILISNVYLISLFTCARINWIRTLTSSLFEHSKRTNKIEMGPEPLS